LKHQTLAIPASAIFFCTLAMMNPSHDAGSHLPSVHPLHTNIANIATSFQPAENASISPPAPDPRLNLLDTAAFSPVNEYGCFEFDRVIKAGELLKRGKLTKNYKPTHLVLRPFNVSIYADAEHTQLKHLIPLNEISAVAKRRDQKRRPTANGLFTIYHPARNFHFDAGKEQAADDWIQQIRSVARIDEYETGLATSDGEDDGDHTTLGRSSSIAGAKSAPRMIPGSAARAQQASAADHGPYGASVGSFSSISSFGAANFPGSLVSLSTSPTAAESSAVNAKAGGHRSVSQATAEVDQERVIKDGRLYLLKSKGGVKKWRPVWTVLRAKSLAIYPNEQVSACSDDDAADMYRNMLHYSSYLFLQSSTQLRLILPARIRSDSFACK
jgi:PH domain